MRFLSRLQKLENHFLEISGLVPHSQEWFAHWGRKIDQLLAGENPDLRGMPLAVVDAIIEAGEKGQTS